MRTRYPLASACRGPHWLRTRPRTEDLRRPPSHHRGLDAHTVLGLIAFEQSNLAQAKTKLLAATTNMKGIAYLEATVKIDLRPVAQQQQRGVVVRFGVADKLGKGRP